MTSKKQVITTSFSSRLRLAADKINSALLRAYRSWWVRGAVVLLVIWAGWKFRADLREFGVFILDQDGFSAYIRGLGLFGPLLLWSLNALQVLIAILPGHAIAFASGYIYGTLFGFIILYTSTIVAGQAAFLLARHYGRPLVDRFVPERYLSRWDRSSKKHGFTFYLITLLIPVFPTDLLTFVAGLSMISIPKFTLANILGRAPYLFLMSLVGALGVEYVVQGLSPIAWLFLALATLVVILSYQYLLPKISTAIFDEEK